MIQDVGVVPMQTLNKIRAQSQKKKRINKKRTACNITMLIAQRKRKRTGKEPNSISSADVSSGEKTTVTQKHTQMHTQTHKHTLTLTHTYSHTQSMESESHREAATTKVIINQTKRRREEEE